MLPVGLLGNEKTGRGEADLRPDTERQAVSAYIEMKMHSVTDHRNSDGQAATEHCTVVGLLFEPSIVGSRTPGTGSVEVTRFAHTAGWEALEGCKSAEAAVGWSNVGWPIEGKRNGVDLAELRTVVPGGCANNPALEDEEVGASAPDHVLQLVSPCPLHGVVSG
jgi:hypothetical protein